jgi:DNA-binding response OmpR family regulator
MKSKLLLITDRPDIVQVQVQMLVQNGIEVSELAYSIAKNKTSAADLKDYSLILLNIFEEENNSLDLCRRLRTDYHSPILMLAYKHSERFLLHVYEAGADDCLVQPLSMRLMLAKVQAWLRRTEHREVMEGQLEFNNFKFDPVKNELVTPEDTLVRLSKLEARFLHLLIVNSGQIVTTDLILQRVWPGSLASEGNRRMLKALVHRLRRKIEPNPNAPEYIQTVPHEGYSFRLN